MFCVRIAVLAFLSCGALASEECNCVSNPDVDGSAPCSQFKQGDCGVEDAACMWQCPEAPDPGTIEFTGLTPASDATQSRCVGTPVEFEVTVTATIEEGNGFLEASAEVLFLEPIPEDALISTVESTGASVTKSFSWTPSSGEEGAKICFQGFETANSILSTGIRCLNVDISYPPAFAEQQAEGSCKQYKALISQTLNFELTATDQNSNDDVKIFVSGDLPGDDNVLSPDLCDSGDAAADPEASSASSCNPVSRTFSWKPGVDDQGSEHTLTFRARDSQDTCEAGGAYSDKYCVTIVVASPKPEWQAPTVGGGEDSCADAHVFTGYVNCPLEFCLSAHDANDYYGVLISGNDGMPEGMDWLDSDVVEPQEVEDAAIPSTLKRCLSWFPQRGQEGFVYTVDFYATDASGLNRINKCIQFNIVRCKYCVEEGDSLLTIAAEYDLDWLQLWGVNVDVPNPDELYNYELINLCPHYFVRAKDTLDDLAERFGTTPAHVLSMNPDVEDAHSLAVGQELCICPNICS